MKILLIIITIALSTLIFDIVSAKIKVYQEQSHCVADYIPLHVERADIETIEIDGKGSCYINYRG